MIGHQLVHDLVVSLFLLEGCLVVLEIFDLLFLFPDELSSQECSVFQGLC